MKQQYETEMDSRTVCGNVQKSGKMQQKHILFHQDSGFRHIALLCISLYTIPLASWLVVTSSTLNVLFFPKSRSAPGLNLTLHTVLKQMLSYPPKSRAAGSQSQQNADLPIGCWSLCIALKHYCSSSVNQNHMRPGVQLPPTFQLLKMKLKHRVRNLVDNPYCDRPDHCIMIIPWDSRLFNKDITVQSEACQNRLHEVVYAINNELMWSFSN